MYVLIWFIDQAWGKIVESLTKVEMNRDAFKVHEHPKNDLMRSFFSSDNKLVNLKKFDGYQQWQCCARIPRDPKSVTMTDEIRMCLIEAILRHSRVDCTRMEGNTLVNSLAVIKITRHFN